jgi:RNA polymerase sigma factor (sigma-70 family)
MAKKRVKMLSAEEERQLMQQYRENGDIKARNKLMEAYMPLATNAAERFARRGNAALKDLVQEAALGLAAAIENFKPGHNSRLSTLAPYYIKSALMRYAMDFDGVVRIGTNFPDKRVFMNLRKKVADLEAQTGGPITDAHRQQIADDLGVKVEAIKRMEPRIFKSDVAVPMTDYVSDDRDEGQNYMSGAIAIQGEQHLVDRDMDQKSMMTRIHTIVADHFNDRDLEIVSERLKGDMTKDRYDVLVERHNISVERIRQIQRAGLAYIRDTLVRDGITGIDSIAC